jgi:hypothetical protein
VRSDQIRGPLRVVTLPEEANESRHSVVDGELCTRIGRAARREANAVRGSLRCELWTRRC